MMLITINRFVPPPAIIDYRLFAAKLKSNLLNFWYLPFSSNGEPLPMKQGFPLRLIIPVKYGIKSIKRIGTMYFDNEKPPDYWAERGYDYFAGL